jgi:hypothetical protein
MRADLKDKMFVGLKVDIKNRTSTGLRPAKIHKMHDPPVGPYSEKYTDVPIHNEAKSV